MQNHSRKVTSNQRGPHPGLAVRVARHLASPWHRTIPDHTATAVAAIERALAQQSRPLVLDSFCGTGESTAALAKRHPEHLVIGVDKSADRLARHTGEGGYLLLRTTCEDLWAALVQRGHSLDFHYLLYPNPWPKSVHLGRRIHGHGALPWLLRLSGRVELRSNWRLYVEEFGLALSLAGHRGAVSELAVTAPITAFERKYAASGHRLWCYRARLAAATGSRGQAPDQRSAPRG